MNPKKLLERIRKDRENVDFRDFIRLVEKFGFQSIGTKGSHHRYFKVGIPETLNLQPKNGEGIAYQIADFLRIIDKNGMKLKG